MAWVRFRCNINCVEDPENCISEKLFMGIADTMVRDGWRDDHGGVELPRNERGVQNCRRRE
jgi:hypothetical protein